MEGERPAVRQSGGREGQRRGEERNGARQRERERAREGERRKEWEVSGGQGEEAEEEAAVQKVLVELVTSLSKGEVGTFFPPLCGFSQCRFLTCGSHARQGCCGSVCVCVCVCVFY